MLSHDLGLSSEPILKIVAIFTTTLLVIAIGTLANQFLSQFERANLGFSG